MISIQIVFLWILIVIVGLYINYKIDQINHDGSNRYLYGIIYAFIFGGLTFSLIKSLGGIGFFHIKRSYFDAPGWDFRDFLLCTFIVAVIAFLAYIRRPERHRGMNIIIIFLTVLSALITVAGANMKISALNKAIERAVEQRNSTSQ